MAESREIIEAREKTDDKDFFAEIVKTMPLLIEWQMMRLRMIKKLFLPQ